MYSKALANILSWLSCTVTIVDVAFGSETFNNKNLGLKQLCTAFITNALGYKACLNALLCIPTNVKMEHILLSQFPVLLLNEWPWKQSETLETCQETLLSRYLHCGGGVRYIKRQSNSPGVKRKIQMLYTATDKYKTTFLIRNFRKWLTYYLSKTQQCFQYIGSLRSNFVDCMLFRMCTQYNGIFFVLCIS